MSLNDITVFKHYPFPFNPFQTRINPSNKTVSFLTKLLNDEYFQNKIRVLREKHQIPQNGFQAKLLKKYKQYNVKYNIDKYNGVYDIEPLRDRMKVDIEEIVKYYNIDWNYNWLFFLLITHNAFVETKPEDIPAIRFFQGKDMIEQVSKVYNDPIGAIFILNNITKEELKKWIDENWDINEAWCDFRYHMPKIPRQKGTYLNATLDTEIADLRFKDKSYKEISEVLYEKYPENERVCDTGWLKTRFYRYKKKSII